MAAEDTNARKPRTLTLYRTRGYRWWTEARGPEVSDEERANGVETMLVREVVAGEPEALALALDRIRSAYASAALVLTEDDGTGETPATRLQRVCRHLRAADEQIQIAQAQGVAIRAAGEPDDEAIERLARWLYDYNPNPGQRPYDELTAIEQADRRDDAREAVAALRSVSDHEGSGA